MGDCFDSLHSLTDGFGQDVGVLQDCERIVTEATDGLGGLDIIISNAVSTLGLISVSPCALGVGCTFLGLIEDVTFRCLL